MRMRFLLFGLCLVLLYGGCASGGQSDAELTGSAVETFSGHALVTTTRASGATTRLTISIQEYTSDEDIQKYAAILKEQGQPAFRSALEKVTAGWLAPTGQVREPINIARSHDVEGGRVINIVKTRYLRFLEFAYGTPRSRDYDITFIQLKVNEKGEGNGFMFAGTKLMFDEEGKLVLEQRGTVPIQINMVRLLK